MLDDCKANDVMYLHFNYVDEDTFMFSIEVF